MERLTEKVIGCNQIIKCGNDLCKETCEEWSCDFCPISEAIDKLADYEDAEEQGLLLRLPCKVGDTVYTIHSVAPNRNMICEIDNVDKFFLMLSVAEERFGKTVFLTKEEAEQALAEMRGDSDA